MKYLSKINIFLFLFLSNFQTSICQGLIFDSTEFNKQTFYSVDRGILPDRVSLEKYLPVLYPQTGGTCVAMSAALARTIMYAYANKITDTREITRNSFSPYFIYYNARNKYDYECSTGLNPVDAIKFIRQVGCEKLINIEYPGYWPFTDKYLCPNTRDFIPPEKSNHIKNARLYRITEAYVTKSVDGIKSALAKKIPVILAMQIPKSFENPNSVVWQSLSNETRSNGSGHAMVAIGYDDNLFGGAIRIANSWGDNWGDDGKIWIKYTELEYWLDGAFIMIAPSTLYKQNNSSDANINNSPLIYRKFDPSEYDGKVSFDNTKYVNQFRSNN
jgi:hypothetical protein